MLKLRVRPLTLASFIEMVETVPGFAFARFSDGGFFCLQGRKGRNCDGVVYTQEQASELLAAIRNRSIVHGLTSIAIHAAKAEEWLDAMQLDVDWYDADVMNKASDMGELLPFVECLRQRKILVCGPIHLHRLQAFPILKFVTCHGSQAFEEVDALEQEISYQVGKNDIDTVLVSAGQGAAPTLVSRLHGQFPTTAIIDVGSLWDPYVGVMSRSGHKRVGWEGYIKLGWKNLNQNIGLW